MHASEGLSAAFLSIKGHSATPNSHSESIDPEMKKPRTGGAGLLGFHGEPVMAMEHHHTTRFRL